MNFPLFVARRYLFSHKKHSAINIISAISALGVAVAAMAMVVTLSVFNGFQDLVAGLFTDFDPQLRIEPAWGKTLQRPDSVMRLLARDPDVAVVSPALEEQALIVKDGQQLVVTVKGVDESWAGQANLQKILYPHVSELPVLQADVLQYGIFGEELALRLNITLNHPDPITLYAPEAGKVNNAIAATGFGRDDLFMSGYIFRVNQSKYDANYVITSLDFAQQLFGCPDSLSHVEVRLKGEDAWGRAQKRIAGLLGTDYRVVNRYEQQQDVFQIMRIEKLVAYLFLSFILLIAGFNIIGSLSMLMIDKRQDVRTLRNLGARQSVITRLFTYEGFLVSFIGALSGCLLGVLLCYLQQQFGLVSMGNRPGAFIIESYPVSVRLWDVAAIFFTVMAVNLLVVWWPVRRLARKLLD
ncbi:MAG: FtsX-like permease family protein [Bacteroidaceae bacterium]|nr:FtsX-like permease family protein [Bacteroidaceae bacterium]